MHRSAKLMLVAVIATAHPPVAWGEIRAKKHRSTLHLVCDEAAEHHHGAPAARITPSNGKAHVLHKARLPAGTTVHAVSANAAVGHVIPSLSLVSGPASAMVTVGSMQVLGLLLLALLLWGARAKPEVEDPLFRPKGKPNVKRR